MMNTMQVSEEENTLTIDYTDVRILLRTTGGRTFGFGSDGIRLMMPIVEKVGELRRDMILEIVVSDCVLQGIKEMEEVRFNSLDIEKSKIRKIRGD